jgi:tetratricopeptide (TPR) repeat protein
MAVHRKRPLPRYPLLGTRLRWPTLILGVLLASSGVAASAEAQEGGGSLSSGAASFAAGKYELAARQMTSAIGSDQLSASQAAKALYLRGASYQRLGQPARAIADLGAALWLGLSSDDRVSALVNRSLAYRTAGLVAEADADLAAARKAGGSGEVDKLIANNGGSPSAASIAAFSTEVRQADTVEPALSQERPSPAPAPERTADAAGSWTTTMPDEPSSGNRLTRLWGSIRGSSSESEPAPAPPPPAAPTAWTTQTQAAPEGARVATASPTAPVASGGGNYRLQLTPTRSEAEARALWNKVVSTNSQLAATEPRIEQTDMGNLGTFYRLQIGPFPDKAESLKLCNALKRSGVDCFLVNP